MAAAAAAEAAAAEANAAHRDHQLHLALHGKSHRGGQTKQKKVEAATAEAKKGTKRAEQPMPKNVVGAADPKTPKVGLA